MGDTRGAGPGSEADDAGVGRGAGRAVRRVGFVAGPGAFVVAWTLLPESGPAGAGPGLPPEGRATAALAAWMAVWWMTEALPVYATALLPLAVLPLAGARDVDAAAAPYAHELIFLFLGGFVVALAMERWGLHERIALLALRRVGTRADRVVGGFMVVTAGLSMFVSNTATAMVMLPIALSVVGLGEREPDDASRAASREAAPTAGDAGPVPSALLLGIAYGASIGGVATLIGTPPNLFLASYVKSQQGLEITFAGWLRIGLPLVGVFLPLAWWLLTRWLLPVRGARIAAPEALHRELGPLGRGERVVLAVAVATAAAWIARPLLVEVEVAGLRPLAGLTDTGIAIVAALVLFAFPVDPARERFAVDWETAKQLPWGLLVLFGGGLSLADAIRDTGVDRFLGEVVGAWTGLPPLVLVAAVAALVLATTELTSNTATTAALVPVLAGIAPGLGVHPFALIVPAALAASCAFMLPVATPPNAIVFGSGLFTVPQMARAGLPMNLLALVLVTATVYALALPLLGATAGAG